jgi:hypothetical protein
VRWSFFGDSQVSRFGIVSLFAKGWMILFNHIQPWCPDQFTQRRVMNVFSQGCWDFLSETYSPLKNLACEVSLMKSYCHSCQPCSLHASLTPLQFLLESQSVFFQGRRRTFHERLPSTAVVRHTGFTLYE